MNYTVPLSAALFPPNWGPRSEDYLPQTLTAVQTEVTNENANAGRNFAGKCADWLTENTQRQAYGNPLTPKPVAPPSVVLHNITTAEGDTVNLVDPIGNVVSSSSSIAAGSLYLWVTSDGAPVGPPCPDLPPMKTQIHVVLTGNDRVMNVPVGDTTPVGTVVSNPVNGTLWKRMESQGPFGPYEYYLHVDAQGNAVAV